MLKCLSLTTSPWQRAASSRRGWRDWRRPWVARDASGGVVPRPPAASADASSRPSAAPGRAWTRSSWRTASRDVPQRCSGWRRKKRDRFTTTGTGQLSVVNVTVWFLGLKTTASQYVRCSTPPFPTLHPNLWLDMVVVPVLTSTTLSYPRPRVNI